MVAITKPGVAAAPAAGIDWIAALKEAALAAFITLMLTVTIIGLHLRDDVRGLILTPRYADVAVAVILVFIGRFGLALVRQGLALPVLIGALVVAVAGWFLDLPSIVLHVVTVGGGLALALHAARAIAWPAAIALGLVALALLSFVASWPASPIGGIAVWLVGPAEPDVFDLQVTAAARVVVAALLVAAGAWVLWRWLAAGGGAARSDASAIRVTARLDRSTGYIGPAAMLIAIALPFLFYDRSTIDTATLVLTYVMLAWGLNIIVGLAGLLDLGYVAFYAVGAYAYGLLATTFGWSFWACLPLAGILAGGFGLLLGYPVLRLRGDYFAIVTLGFGEIIRIILINWTSFTGGPQGIAGVPRPSFFGLAEFDRSPAEGVTAFHDMFGLEFQPIHRLVFLYYLILLLALVVNLVSVRLRRLPIGRAWEALREDDVACQSLGINRRNIKLAAFGISAMFGGIAGSFFATRQGYISPESFGFIELAKVLAIVVLGGMGSQVGIVLAAIILIGLPEVFRELQEYRMLAFGGAMVLIMLWRPRGLLSHRAPTIRLGRERPPPAPVKAAA